MNAVSKHIYIKAKKAKADFQVVFSLLGISVYQQVSLVNTKRTC